MDRRDGKVITSKLLTPRFAAAALSSEGKLLQTFTPPSNLLIFQPFPKSRKGEMIKPLLSFYSSLFGDTQTHKASIIMQIITITQKREQYGGCGGRLRRLSVPFTIVRRQVMLHDDEDD